MLSDHVTQVHLSLGCNRWKEWAERECDKPHPWVAAATAMGTQITRKISICQKTLSTSYIYTRMPVYEGTHDISLFLVTSN